MGTIPTRDEALALLKEYNRSETLIKHGLAVEDVMRYMARKKGEDVTRIKLLDSWMANRAILIERMAFILKSRPEIPLEINAEAAVPLEDVIRLLDTWQAIGRGDVTFVGAPPQRPR